VELIWSLKYKFFRLYDMTYYPGDLDTRKSTGTSCQIEIHFMIKTTEYLLKYTLFRFHIFVRAIVLITKHNYKISTSFIKNNEKYTVID
jgi:hypothetical protein